jgi:putative Holliday junction resolvase
VDLGTVRIGLAISDPSGRIATPLATLDAASLSGRDADPRALAKAVAVRLASVAQQEACEAVVLGLPRALSGRDTSMTELVRSVAAALRDENITVELWDERFSSVEAERVLLGADQRRKRRTQQRDRVAATIILQGWLDARAHRTRHRDRDQTR